MTMRVARDERRWQLHVWGRDEWDSVLPPPIFRSRLPHLIVNFRPDSSPAAFRLTVPIFEEAPARRPVQVALQETTWPSRPAAEGLYRSVFENGGPACDLGSTRTLNLASRSSSRSECPGGLCLRWHQYAGRQRQLQRLKSRIVSSTATEVAWVPRAKAQRFAESPELTQAFLAMLT
jgi:hypothetical protein